MVILMLLTKLAAMTDSPVDDMLVEELKKRLSGDIISQTNGTNSANTSTVSAAVNTEDVQVQETN